MKIKKIAGVLALAGLLSPMFANAQDSQLGVYIAPKFVYGATRIKNVYFEDETSRVRHENVSDDSFGGSFAIGYDFRQKYNTPIRAEMEYAVLSKAKRSGESLGNPASYSQRAQTLFLNAYYDIDTGTKFTPYVGAGMGMAFVKTKAYYEPVTYDSRTSNNFAWNLGLGLAYEITRNVKLDAGYRFVDLGKAGTNWTAHGGGQERFHSGRMQQHQFSVGVRIGF